MSPDASPRTVHAVPMSQSPTVGELAKALSKAQSSMESAKKDSQNPHLRNKYADLRSCWAAARGPLGENGLAVVQTTESVTPDAVKIISTLVHESGEWVRGELVVPCGGNKGVNAAQAMGSAISYGRRYAFMALVGISADDDDGHSSSSGNAPQTQPSNPFPTPQSPRRQQTSPTAPIQQREAVQGAPVSENQRKAIWAASKSKNIDPHHVASQVVGHPVGSLNELSFQEASKIIDHLNGKRQQSPNPAYATDNPF